MSHKSLQDIMYGNCKILAPDGQLLCRCKKERLDWYLTRNLAVAEDSCTIRLNFEPKGRHADEFYLQERDNVCVVCGNENNLTKHHCVPQCYRRFFEKEIKSRSCHDVLPICVDCHVKYEIYASELKHKLFEENITEHKIELNENLIRASKAAYVLKTYTKIPEDRKVKLLDNIKDYLGYNPSEQEIENLAKIDFKLLKGKNLSNSFSEIVKLFGHIKLIEVWRNHFVETMKPQFLPKLWNSSGH